MQTDPYIFPRRTTLRLVWHWKDSSVQRRPMPIPETVVSVSAAIGRSDGSGTASAVPAEMDRPSGTVAITITPAISSAMSPNVSYTLDCLTTNTDGSRWRMCQVLLAVAETITP